jgi:hypothetical protein
MLRMLKHTLSFRVDAHPGSPIAPVRREPEPLPAGRRRFGGVPLDCSDEVSYRKQLADSLGLEIRHFAWINCELSWPRLPELVDRLKSDIASGLIQMGAGYSEERFDTSAPQCEWFKLTPAANIARADAMLPDFHVAGRYGGCPFVSERFREIAEAAGLTGIEFLWVTDESRFRANQWYRAFATQPLGRGLDHSWFDAATLEGGGSFQWTDPEFRTGVWLFKNDQFKSDAIDGNSAGDRMLRLFPPKALTVHSFRRVLRDSLPSTDFAYVWDSKPGRPLCFNRKARDVLVRGGLLREDEYTGIEVLNEVPAGSARIDSVASCPPPFYSTETLRDLRMKEKAALSEFRSNPLPERSDDLDRSIELLKACLEENQSLQHGLKPVTARRLQRLSRELPFPLPDAWQRVLSIASGGYLPGDVYITPVAELPKHHALQQTAIEPGDPTFGQKLLHVAKTGGGDWFSLVVEVRDSIDVPVLQTDHEADRVARRWETVAAFLEEMVESDD